jgi:hypothetical protein
VKTFAELSPNFRRTFAELSQNIHGRVDETSKSWFCIFINRHFHCKPTHRWTQSTFNRRQWTHHSLLPRYFASFAVRTHNSLERKQQLARVLRVSKRASWMLSSAGASNPNARMLRVATRTFRAFVNRVSSKTTSSGTAFSPCTTQSKRTNHSSTCREWHPRRVTKAAVSLQHEFA